MPTLIIPSRNRPTSITSVLNYLARFYPGAMVLVADGSDPGYRNAYEEATKKYSERLDLTYKYYGANHSLADRMVDALASIDDEFIIVGADDDYPVLNVLLAQETFLQSNPDYVLATGGVVALRLFQNGDLQAKLLHARSIEQSAPVNRLKEYSKWPYATSYGLVRRTHYIERCARADLNGFPGFGDFTVGFHDCLAGKIKALEKISYFRTSNPVHSRLGRGSKLFYLERAAEILAIKDHYAEALLELQGMTSERAEKFAVRLINTRISQLITRAPQNQAGFGESELFKDPTVSALYDEFSAIFIRSTKPRQQHIEKLERIMSGLKSVVAAGSDNVGEPSIYGSLQEMLSDNVEVKTQ